LFRAPRAYVTDLIVSLYRVCSMKRRRIWIRQW